jgi:polyphosphate glucokinase
MKGSKSKTSSARAVAASETSAMAVGANLEAEALPGPFTLAIDIGGTRVKGTVLSANGELAAEPRHLATPIPATPDQVIRVIASIVSSMPSFARISAGFPGVVKQGYVVTAPNLGTASWRGVDLATELSRKFDAPARVLNDAAVQGLGVVEGPGLECVLTLGTGVGCAVYRARRLVLPLEFGQHHRRRGKNYDAYLGNTALQTKGVDRWNKRLAKTIGEVVSLINCDVLYLGGGNARKIALQLPANVKVVSNLAGITGGLRLWDPDMEEHFS